MVGAKLIELVLAGGSALAQTGQAVGELLAVIGQHRSDADPLPGRALRSNGPRGGAGPFQVA